MNTFIRFFALAFAVYRSTIGTVHASGVLAIANPADNGQVVQAYATADAFVASDHAKLFDLSASGSVRYSPRAGVNSSLASSRVETGVQWQGYRIAVISRGDAFLMAGRDTIDLANQYTNALSYDSHRSYAVDYQVRAFEANGLKLSKSMQVSAVGDWTVKTGLGLSYLKGKSLKLDSVNGQAITLNTKDFDALLLQSVGNTSLNTLNLNEFNAPFGRQERFSSDGYAVDAGVIWTHFRNGTQLELAVADLLGEMYWNNVPSNMATLTMATKSYDANGFVQYDPATTRASSYKSISMRLEPKVYFGAGIPWKQVMFTLGTSYTHDQWFPQLGLQYTW